eukprot:7432184-Pyramimonas_sp.AAC.1
MRSSSSAGMSAYTRASLGPRARRKAVTSATRAGCPGSEGGRSTTRPVATPSSTVRRTTVCRLWRASSTT